eukprot:TRINITY_DN1928_c3_g1_i1.p2 TRINITY_DN1928_c3_g1~~TRINITY_DN1928_c3_g1_i1.p2  ORF type:complete len:108 (+),score=62.55 TRINITY_DN1928_c3_g1_i1:40-363(+)
MKLIAAYLLAVLGGNAHPDAAAIKNILNSVGIEADEERLTALLAKLDGKDVNEVMEEGRGKLSSIPAGGAMAGGAAAAQPEAKEEEKKEEEEEEEEEEADMGFSLFD